MKEKFIRFMYGRYGFDSFGKFTFAVSIILMFLSTFRHSGFLNLLCWLMLIYTYYRMFSRQIEKRSKENQKFLASTASIRRWFYKQKNLMQQRKTHHIYRCPNCKQQIRVPKGKGKIEIRCPKCNHTFIKNS